MNQTDEKRRVIALTKTVRAMARDARSIGKRFIIDAGQQNTLFQAAHRAVPVAHPEKSEPPSASSSMRDETRITTPLQDPHAPPGATWS